MICLKIIMLIMLKLGVLLLHWKWSHHLHKEHNIVQLPQIPRECPNVPLNVKLFTPKLQIPAPYIYRERDICYQFTGRCHITQWCWVIILFTVIVMSSKFVRVSLGITISDNTTTVWRLVCKKHVSMARTCNYIPQYLWDLITCSCLWYLHLAHKLWFCDVTQNGRWDLDKVTTSLIGWAQTNPRVDIRVGVGNWHGRQ